MNKDLFVIFFSFTCLPVIAGDTKLLPVINDDKTLNTAEYTDDYYLVRAKVSSGSCASLCFEKDNTQSCADKCNEQLEAIKADLIGSREDLQAHNYNYNIQFVSSDDEGKDVNKTVNTVAEMVSMFEASNQLPDELEAAIKAKENEADYKRLYPDISAIKLFDDYDFHSYNENEIKFIDAQGSRPTLYQL